MSHYGYPNPFSSQKFLPGSGRVLYRRSLYTAWKRTSPPPSMAIFDAPSRETCSVRRLNTNTPLQALVLQNDPQFLEAARALGDLMAAAGSPQDGIDLGAKRVLGRARDEGTGRSLGRAGSLPAGLPIAGGEGAPIASLCWGTGQWRSRASRVDAGRQHFANMDEAMTRQ